MEHLELDTLHNLQRSDDRLRFCAYLVCWISGAGEFAFDVVDRRLQDGWTVAAIRDSILEELGGPVWEKVVPAGHPLPPGPDVSIAPYYEAMLRHMSGWWEGERLCAGTRIHHLAHVVACCAIIIDAEDGKLLIDDRDTASRELGRLLAAFPAPRSKEDAYVDQAHMDLSELWLKNGSYYVSDEAQLYPVWG
jgi:hypothetical protein